MYRSTTLASALLLATAAPLCAATYELSLDAQVSLGTVHTPFADPSPTPDGTTAGTGSATAGTGLGVYSPDGATVTEAMLDISGMGVSGHDTSWASASWSLGVFQSVTSTAPWPPGGDSQTALVSYAFSGFMTLISEINTWAGASLSFDFLDAETGEVLSQLDRSPSPEDNTGWYAVDASDTRGNYVFCGGSYSGPIGGSGTMELIGTAAFEVVVTLTGAAGPAECEDDPTLFLPPDMVAANAALVAAPLPAAAPMLLAALGLIAWRRRV